MDTPAQRTEQQLSAASQMPSTRSSSRDAVCKLVSGNWNAREAKRVQVSYFLSRKIDWLSKCPPLVEAYHPRKICVLRTPPRSYGRAASAPSSTFPRRGKLCFSREQFSSRPSLVCSVTQFGPETTGQQCCAVNGGTPGRRWILDQGLRGGSPGKPPCWRTLKESCKGLGSVSLINKQPTHTP
jgi:hypothetical protein